MIHSTVLPFLPQVNFLFKKHKIKSAYIFGSALTDKFSEKSDVDFLVNMEENLDPVDAGEHLWDLTFELEDLLNRKIDLITEKSIKNPYFKSELNKTKFSIYG